MSEIETGIGTVIGRIETDTFCQSCGYNLHTQNVIRDERLGILVCRCPECGRYAPAGQATAASRLWLNRLGTTLLTAWVFLLLLLFGLCTLFLGMVAYGQVMESTQTRPIIRHDPNHPKATYYTFEYVIRDTPPTGSYEAQQMSQERIILAVVTGALGLVAGGMFSVFLWHCKSWRRLFAFGPPVIGCGIASCIWASNPMASPIRNWGLLQLGTYFLLELVAVFVGVLLGRAIARAALGLLLSPKIRQHLAFLWTTDGKILKIQ